MKPFSLPDGFLLGSATAATQIEGGDTNNNWYDWCQRGKIKDNTSCVRANDHWNRYEEDIQLMTELNHKIYRMGLEWSRIEPQKGLFDELAIQHYREELDLLVKKGIKPLVTLHHFSHPLWLSGEGGFEQGTVVEYFRRYTAFVVERLGDLVSEFITINEPNVYGINGYVFGEWPPGKKNLRECLKVFKHMALCHIIAYKAIHEIRSKNGFKGQAMVGVANHLQYFVPHSNNPLDKLATKTVDYLFQDALIKSMTSGNLRFPIGTGAPLGTGKFHDFIGINYYTRNEVRFNRFKVTPPANTKKNDLGWDVYPEGLSQLCTRFYKEYKAPIWITENGTCDRKDEFRAKYVFDHLHELSRLADQGIPVERYYHWTLMDNFEWVEGEAARFGLIHVDYETQKRTIRKSGRFYGQICETNSVTEEMIQRYLGEYE